MTTAAEHTPIVLVASGTTTTAAVTYRRIEAGCRHRFPEHPIHWAYSSRAIRRRRQEEGGDTPPTPEAVFDRLFREGCPKAVVQSLHLLCGVEFHRLAWRAAVSPLTIHLGLPLLAAPQDFEALLEWIEAVRPQSEDEALVLVGHGTDHPAWTAYAVLAHRLARRYGEMVQLGHVKGDPDPSCIADRLATAGLRRVQLRPLMLVAGAHFMQDIAGPQPASWRSQFERRGLRVTSTGEGLDAHPVPMAVFNRHIEQAMAAPPLRLD